MSGGLITIDGIEGAGKSTAINYLQSSLENKGEKVVVTREPGGTELGEKLRDILLAKDSVCILPETELMLMYASRYQHINEKIKPLIESGHWVLSDRFNASSFAYQGYARGVDLERLAQLDEWVLQGMKPDVSFVFDLPLSVAKERMLQRGRALDRIEQELDDFFIKASEGFRAFASANQHAVIIDASLGLEDVLTQLEFHLPSNWSEFD